MVKEHSTRRDRDEGPVRTMSIGRSETGALSERGAMTLENPVLSLQWRGSAVESIHRGAWVVADTAGAVVGHLGDPEQRIFARSATKGLQALPLVESRGADVLRLEPAELAVAIGSHSGEAVHVDAVRSLLSKAGLDETWLQCGDERPRYAGIDAAADRIYHNCSGKHAGFLAAAVVAGQDPTTYLDPNGLVQQRVAKLVADLSGCDDLGIATDGCSAPTYRLPIRALATAAARIANPERLAADRAEACVRLTDAAAAHPTLVGGSIGRIDTDLLRATRGAAFAKVGAQGVILVGLVGRGIGLAVKVDDGHERGYQQLVIDLLGTLGAIDATARDELSRWWNPVLTNPDNLEVGRQETNMRATWWSKSASEVQGL